MLKLIEYDYFVHIKNSPVLFKSFHFFQPEDDDYGPGEDEDDPIDSVKHT